MECAAGAFALVRVPHPSGAFAARVGPLYYRPLLAM